VANKDRAAVESGLSDILGNVIQSDRRRAGRGEEAPPPSAHQDSMTSPIVLKEADNKTITQYDNNTVRQPNNSASPSSEAGIETAAASEKQRPTKREPKDERPLLQRRIAEAEALASSPTTTVTLRIPLALNDWLDEYVHGSWPEKVKKQQLVTEALQLLFARRGKPKEAILPTELLPNDE